MCLGCPCGSLGCPWDQPSLRKLLLPGCAELVWPELRVNYMLAISGGTLCAIQTSLWDAISDLPDTELLWEFPQLPGVRKLSVIILV